MHICKLFIICTVTVVIFATQASSREIVINAVGDIMLAGSGAATYKRLGYDYPFAATKELLKKGDIVMGNLESPIARGGDAFTSKKFHYRSAPQTATALKNAGFSLVTLANNHMLDYGASALEETRRNLDRAGIGYTGAGASINAARRSAVISVRGVKIAFLAYSLTLPGDFYAGADRSGTAPGFFSFYRDDIAAARKVADYVLVSFHWGTENSDMPKTYQVTAAHRAMPKTYQVTTAHRAIDAGADLVIGHHPHVLQGVERYKNGVIFYSLGNFAFGTVSKTARRSVIARVTLETGIKGVELIPLNVLNREVHFQPQVLTGRKAQDVIDHLNNISRKWNTNITASGGRYLVKMGNSGVLARQ